MKAAFRTYLKRIAVPEQHVRRIEAALSIAELIIPEEIQDLFVSELTSPDGTRQYVGVWFLGERFLSEANPFVAQDRFDCVPLAQNLIRYEVSWSDYDFEQARKSSQLTAHFQMVNEVTGNLFASGLNCDHLRDVLLDYIAPNAVG